MKLVRGAGVALVALLVVSGCAKKKAAPPRGTLLGNVIVHEPLAATLFSEAGFNPKSECFQLVELNDKNKMKVVEISHGTCPEFGISDESHSQLKVWGAVDAQSGAENYLTMGTSSYALENTPVGLMKSYKRTPLPKNGVPTFDIIQLCSSNGRMNLAGYCKLVSDAKGALVKIDYDRFATLDRALLNMGLTNLENADFIKKEIAKLTADAGKLKTELADLGVIEGKIAGKAVELRKEVEAINKKADDIAMLLVSISKAVDSPQYKKIKAEAEGLKEIIDTILSDTTKKALGELDTNLKALAKQIKAIGEDTRSDEFKATAKKVVDLAELLTETKKSINGEDFKKLVAAVKDLSANYDAAIGKKADVAKLTAEAEKLQKLLNEILAKEKVKAVEDLQKMTKELDASIAKLVKDSTDAVTKEGFKAAVEKATKLAASLEASQALVKSEAFTKLAASVKELQETAKAMLDNKASIEDVLKKANDIKSALDEAAKAAQKLKALSSAEPVEKPSSRSSREEQSRVDK